jgi:hypothetical protein
MKTRYIVGTVAAAGVLAACSGDQQSLVAPEGGITFDVSIATARATAPAGILPFLFQGNDAAGVCAEGQKYYKFDARPVGDDISLGGFATVTSDGTYLAWTATAGTVIHKVVMKGGPGYNVFEYSGQTADGHVDGEPLSETGLYSPSSDAGTAVNVGRPAAISHVSLCYTDEPVTENSLLTVLKFYDANANGEFDEGEVELSGWSINVALNGGGAFLASTEYSSPFPNGTTYAVSENMPNEMNWIQTEPIPNLFEGTLMAPTTLAFGNVCLGAGNGLTLGYWSNRNGERRFGEIGGLAVVNAYTLRNGAGLQVTPFGNYATFRTWLLGASATNMAYMLSAQTAAMALNVASKPATGDALVYAPGTGSANDLGFASINALLAEAEEILAANGVILADSPVRTRATAVKDALDHANNNTNFVQASPCDYTFPEPTAD